jgi:hypothetical protein
LKLAREKKIEATVDELKDMIKQLYEVQMKPETFDFDFKSLEGANSGEEFKNLAVLC